MAKESELESLIRTIVREELAAELTRLGLSRIATVYSNTVLPPGVGPRRFKATAVAMLKAQVPGVVSVRRGFYEVEASAWREYHRAKHESQIPKPPDESQVVAKMMATGKLRRTR